MADEQVRNSRLGGGFHPHDRDHLLGGWFLRFFSSPPHVPQGSQHVRHRHVHGPADFQFQVSTCFNSEPPACTGQAGLRRQLVQQAVHRRAVAKNWLSDHRHRDYYHHGDRDGTDGRHTAQLPEGSAKRVVKEKRTQRGLVHPNLF